MSLMQWKPTTEAPGRVLTVRAPWQRSLLTFLMVVGPGLIVTTANNDAGTVL